MSNKSFKIVLLITFSLTIAKSVHASPSDYTFYNLVDSTASDLSRFSAPALNNHGQVAFTAVSGATIGVFRAGLGGFATIAQSDVAATDLTLIGPTINDSGVVAFTRRGPADINGGGVFTGDGVSTTLVSPLNSTEAILGLASVNNDGIVAYTGNSNGVGLFANKNGQANALALAPPFALGDFDSVQPQINNAGEIIFRAGVTGLQDLYEVNASGGALTKLVNHTDLGTSAGVGSKFSVNNSGRVAFVIQGQGAPFATDIATSDGGTISIVAQAQLLGNPFDSVDDPSINDSNEVAFYATSHQNGLFSGIFTGPDFDSNRVIGIGDKLFGSVVTSIAFDPNGLNDNGEIAFVYSLTDGTAGVAIAAPDVPEPASIRLLCCLTSIVLLTRFRQRS